MSFDPLRSMTSLGTDFRSSVKRLIVEIPSSVIKPPFAWLDNFLSFWVHLADA